MKTRNIAALTALSAAACLILTDCRCSKKQTEPAPEPEENQMEFVVPKPAPKPKEKAPETTETETVTSDTLTTASETATTDTDTLTTEPVLSEKEKRLLAELAARPRILTSPLTRAEPPTSPTLGVVEEARKKLETMPPLPPPVFDVNTTLSKEQWKGLSVDQAVSQANARFQKTLSTVKEGQFLDKEEAAKTMEYLTDYKTKLLSVDIISGDAKNYMSKEEYEFMQDSVNDACAALQSASGYGNQTNTGSVRADIDKAADYLRDAEAIARSCEARRNAAK